jgi:folylpolyglutamate synthase/dihydropteroate synthase
MSKKGTCEYCGVSNEQIKKLRENKLIFSKSGRGFSLEVDRKDPNLEYTKYNCCMACYWCNNAKTDEYLPFEFKEIARGINTEWNRRLKLIDENKNVVFDEKAAIWEIDESDNESK